MLVDGTWARLAGEPYDATFELAAALVLVSIAGTLAWEIQRRLAAVSGPRAPHPAQRGLAGADAEGTLMLWAADAGPQDRPLLSIDAVPYELAEPDLTQEELEAPAEVPDLPDLASLADGLCRRDLAILHGIPYDGATVAIEIRDGDSDPVLYVPRAPDPCRPRASRCGRDLHRLVSGRSSEASGMVGSGAPRVYQLPTAWRAVVFGAWLVMLGLGAWEFSAPRETDLSDMLLLWGVGLWASWAMVMALTHGIVADTSGVHVRKGRGWQSRSWDELYMAESTGTSVLLHTQSDEGAALESSGLPGAAVLRGLGIRNLADRCADQVNAMIRDASLRPRTTWREPAAKSPVVALG